MIPCYVQDKKDKTDVAHLLVAPCFLPDILAGPYWIIGIGPSPNNYEWAVVSGGQPTVEYPDGCTTKTSSTNGSGLWIFSREPVLSKEYMADAMNALKMQNYTLSQLKAVPQEGCEYKGAFIKGSSQGKAKANKRVAL